jgi:hypothetical protein
MSATGQAGTGVGAAAHKLLRHAPFARTLLAARWINFATGLGRFFDSRKSGAVTRRTNDFSRYLCWFRSSHKLILKRFSSRMSPCRYAGLSHRFHRHPFNLCHVVVRERACFSVIPRNGDFTPRRSDNRAKIGNRDAPTSWLFEPTTGVHQFGGGSGGKLNVTVEVREAMNENNRSATGFLPSGEFETVANQFFAQPHAGDGSAQSMPSSASSARSNMS